MSSRVHDVVTADRLGCLTDGMHLLRSLACAPVWRSSVVAAFDGGFATTLRTTLFSPHGSGGGSSGAAAAVAPLQRADSYRSGAAGSPAGHSRSGKLDWRSEVGTRAVSCALAALYR